ncbi:hypothetical protein [Roseovarius sp. A46]|uniref:hypothetical protein n=1 Tax=Roseovarius sp. A46 TaxID=2109331 RepID=UPI0010108D01|nr:hypothetical protein [Roseovarius sp. A46]
MNFDEVFRYQYCLTRSNLVPPKNWILRKFRNWNLVHCALLNNTEIFDEHGTFLGIVLGISIHPEAGVLKENVTLSISISEPEFWSVFEKFVYDLSGRYVIFASNASEHRVYHDPVLDMASVYNKKQHVVASSLLLAKSEKIISDYHIDLVDLYRDGRNISFGHTVDADVKRAKPNHFLSLNSFKQTRWWPSPDTSFDAGRGLASQNVSFIIDKLKKNCHSMMSLPDVEIPLSGGRDSRNILACIGKNHLKNSEIFTIRTNVITSLDVLSARMISEKWNFPLREIDIFENQYADEFEPEKIRARRMAYFLANGLSGVSSSPADLVANFRSSNDAVNIRGNIMDMIGGNQFKKLQSFEGVDIEHGLRRLSVCDPNDHRKFETWKAKYDAWVSQLPEACLARVYDFAFFELLLPNTLGGKGLISLNSSFRMNPFSDRSLLHLTASIRPKVRRRGILNNAIIEMAAPDLLDVPFTNELKKKPALVRKAVSSFSKIRFFPKESARNYIGITEELSKI